MILFFLVQIDKILNIFTIEKQINYYCKKYLDRMLNFSENKPSKEYTKHIEYYKKMHREGYLFNGWKI